MIQPDDEKVEIGHWFRTDNEAIEMIPKIGPLAYCVYAVMCRFADKDRRCYPSVTTIARKCGVGDRSVQLALRRLTREGMIEVEARSANGKTLSNLYHLPRLTGARDCAPEAVCAPETQCAGAPEFTQGAQENAPGGRKRMRPNKTKEKKTSLKKTKQVGLGDIAIPAELDTPQCRTALEEWLQHHRDIRKPYKSARAVEKLLRKWAEKGAHRFIDAVDHSIAQQYQGLYELRSSNNGKRQTIGAGQEYRPDAAERDSEHGRW